MAETSETVEFIVSNGIQFTQCLEEMECKYDKDGEIYYSDDYLIEFIDEQDNTNNMQIDRQKKYDAYIETHAIVLRQPKFIDKNETFYCLKCQIEYECLDDFKLEHQRLYNKQILETQNLKLSESNCENEKDSSNSLQNFINDQNCETIETQYLDEHFLADSMDCEEANYITNNENLFYCNACQSFFDDQTKAEEHQCTVGCFEKTIISSEILKPIKCQDCKKQFRSSKALAVHSRIHKVKKPSNRRMATTNQAICNICNTIFHSEKNLKLHMKIHTIRHIKTVEEAIPPSLKLHYKEQDKFFCEICKKHFDQNVLVIHQSMHKNEDHICSICNRQFENLLSFEMHLKVHMKKPSLIRPSKSKRINIPGQKLKFPCQYCGREFPRPHEKVRHERVHTGEKPYECEVCGKCFRIPYSLTLHLRTHTEVRPYQCQTCNKSFKSQPVYAHHLKTHLPERGYKCNVCSKAFRTSVQLCAHKNSHSKPFNCSECNRPFSSLYAVKVHMKTHSKTNKFHDNLKHRCSVCGAIYARLFALRYHMRNHHNIEIYDLKKTNEANNILIDKDEEDLITAVTEVDNLVIDENDKFPSGLIQNSHRLNDHEIHTQEILREDVIVDTYQVEETDWLSK